ncbi:MAG: hypothetical protein WC998_01510 [Candidatus Paceibacterota bacterium]|jgi:hypothetical protein
MKPGYYPYKMHATGRIVIAIVLEELQGMSDCVIVYPDGKALHYNTDTMGGEWGEKIKFKKERIKS